MKLAETLLATALSDQGRVRKQNEDAVFVDAALGLAILADGMGGYHGGEIASGMAITFLSANLGARIPEMFLHNDKTPCAQLVQQTLLEQIAVTNQAIYRMARTDARFSGMGTTLVVAWLFEDQLVVAHIGDSRLYRLRGKSLQALTRDHSVLQEQIDRGAIRPEEAHLFPARNLLTRALGVENEVHPDIAVQDVQSDDVFLLCSDGLYEMVDEEGIAMTLRTFGDDLSGAAAHLVAMANEAGGRDNVSVVIVKPKGEVSAEMTCWRRLLGRR